MSVSNNLFVINILQLYHLKYGEILQGKWLVADLVLGVWPLRKARDDAVIPALVLLMPMAFWREEHRVLSSLTLSLQFCKLWVSSLSSYQLPLSFLILWRSCIYSSSIRSNPYGFSDDLVT